MSRLELRLEFRVENLLKDVLEAAVVDLEDGVLRGEVDGVVAAEGVGEAGAGETGATVASSICGHRKEGWVGRWGWVR